LRKLTFLLGLSGSSLVIGFKFSTHTAHASLDYFTKFKCSRHTLIQINLYLLLNKIDINNFTYVLKFGRIETLNCEHILLFEEITMFYQTESLLVLTRFNILRQTTFVCSIYEHHLNVQSTSNFLFILSYTTTCSDF